MMQRILDSLLSVGCKGAEANAGNGFDSSVIPIEVNAVRNPTNNPTPASAVVDFHG